MQAVNVKKINNQNVSLLKEITNCLSECSGILSLAFNRENNKTSPFIHIENSLAFSLNLPSVTVVPNNVNKDGVLFLDHLDQKVVGFDSCDLYSSDNKNLRNQIENLIEKSLIRESNSLSEAFFLSLKEDVIKNNEAIVTKKIKNRYQIKQADLKLKLSNLYIKKPIEVKALEITQSGYYQTKDGKEYLNAGDYLVNNIEDKVYKVGKESFQETYVKVLGTEDKYVKKAIPVLAKRTKNATKIAPLYKMTDVYDVPTNEFDKTYQKLTDYILNVNNHKTEHENNEF